MPRLSRPALLPLLAMLGCTQDVGLTESARCDGLQQRGEEYVDAPFDRDGDGYFDAANPGCQSVYAEADLDCDDTNPDAHPDNVELLCDGADNDCDPETPDDLDGDADGFMACEDCDDADPLVNPGLLEVACNGKDDDCDGSTVDAVDRDGDGFTECEDCDEQRAYVNPNELEVFCDGLDNDCNEVTLDYEDRDNDGSPSCDDCDDGDPDRTPGGEEVCDDGVDNDCDNDVDEECAPDLSGVYFLDTQIRYNCGLNSVNLNVTRIEVTLVGSNLYAIDGTAALQPGSMFGAWDATDLSFSASNVIAGTCTETYEVAGTFGGDGTLSAVFRASFSGARGMCFDCTNQVWAVTGTQQ